MARILILYGTKQRQTEKIAGEIAEELGLLGHTTDLFDVRRIPDSIDPADYDGVLIGAAVHLGGYPWRLRGWVRARAHQLREMPSAFFSVCLGVLQADDRVQEEERAIVRRFFEWTDWRPYQWTIFAGALAYTQYGWFVKRIMRRIARQAGGGTDMSRDYEYTDWNSVRKFAAEFDRRLKRDAPSRRPADGQNKQTSG